MSRADEICKEQEWWMELGSRLGWTLGAHTYQDEATFVTSPYPNRQTIEVNAKQRSDILSAILVAQFGPRRGHVGREDYL